MIRPGILELAIGEAVELGRGPLLLSNTSMPTYEYVCKACGENIEVFQPFSARPLVKHEECGGDLQKVFHARGVVFKGSGFYKTDSRAKVGAGNGKADKSEKSDKGEKSEAKPKEKSPTASSTAKSETSSD